MSTPYEFPDDSTEFAVFPKYMEQVEALAKLAEPENWDYKHSKTVAKFPILRNYLEYTYRRLAYEKKISITPSEDFCCWNTGLITSAQEPIFALFEKNIPVADKKQYWRFWKFARQGERDLNKFPALPEMAHYFDDPSVLVFDTRKEVRINIEHVVAENLARFPPDLQKMNQFGLQNLVKGAIDSSIQRVRRNYKTAIPQCYQGTVQLLLPLSLTDPAKADLALVIEKFPEFYRAATCLTLDMAYNNARQLARPDRDWLAP